MSKFEEFKEFCKTKPFLIEKIHKNYMKSMISMVKMQIYLMKKEKRKKKK